jgi:hypothetical protein
MGKAALDYACLPFCITRAGRDFEIDFSFAFRHLHSAFSQFLSVWNFKVKDLDLFEIWILPFGIYSL